MVNRSFKWKPYKRLTRNMIMDLNQNPENNEEFNNLKTRLITDFTFTCITILLFLPATLILRIFLKIYFYREVYLLAMGWLGYSYIAQFALKKKLISFKMIKKIDFIHYIVDLLFMTGIFYYIGGILWIGAIFFIFTILYASILSPPREALIITLIAFTCYSSVVLLEYLGLIPYKEFFRLTPYLYKDSQYVITTTSVVGLVFFSIFITGKSFAQKLRRRSVELAKAKKELEEWSDKLEEEVRLRTLELKKVNEDLKQDVTKRKQAEQQVKQGYKKLQRTMEATINTISKIIEIRDPYTAGHQNKVSQLAVAIAQEMKLPEDKIEGIRIAALVHDIGKINIPSEILSKPSKLNNMEFSLIKNHPKVGYDILRRIDFFWPVAKIVLQHHEKIDGSGYPKGLKNNNILLEAKIIGVADVVEAMSSHRPYRPALGIDKALKEISQNKGILYDPEVVDTCLKLFKEKGFKF